MEEMKESWTFDAFSCLFLKKPFHVCSFFHFPLFFTMPTNMPLLDVDFDFVMIRFKCVDLDGNGVLTRNELQFFYEEQLHRMECMAQEPVLFEDILCQIIDMIRSEVCFSIFLLLIVCVIFYCVVGKSH